MSEAKTSLLQKMKKKWVSFLISFVITGGSAVMLLSHYRNADGGTDMISSLENKLLDLRFRLRGPRPPTGKIGILAIDEKSLLKFGRWPIARSNYETIFKNLKKEGAEWLGFDVVWSEPERPLLEDVAKNVEGLKKAVEAGNARVAARHDLKEIDDAMAASRGDRSIANALAAYKKIVMGYIYYGNKAEGQSLGADPFHGLDQMANSAIQALILPDGKKLADYNQFKTWGIAANTDFIAKSSDSFAFFNNELSADAIFRWVQLVREVNGTMMPALSLKMAAQMTGREPVVFFDQFGVTDVSLVNPNNDQDLIKIPVDLAGSGQMLLNHLGPRQSIPHISLADVYDDKLTDKQRALIKGMSLILGPTAVGINDLRANPFDSGFDGVEQHATVIDNIVGGNFMHRTETVYKLELGVIIGIAVLFAPLMIFGSAVFSGFGVMLFLAGYYMADKYFWFGRGEWVYMGMPFIEILALFIGNTLYKYIAEEREKHKLKEAFGHFLSPDKIKQMMDSGVGAKLGSEKKELTVFFSDVRGFTTISESLSPEKLGELMNAYFTPMEAIIEKSNGNIDKYIGDAIMAFWGDPIPLVNHADIAVKAAVEMLFALEKLRIDLPKKGFPMIDIGIGLNSDMMSVGNFGSPGRQCYTVMGDAVNLGARLESKTKEYGIKIMISQFTKAKLTDTSLVIRDLDDVKVKGKNDAVRVFEVLRPDILKTEAAVRNLVGEFDAAREAYRRQDWKKMEKHFLACLSIRPDDGPTNYYLKYIEEEQLKLKPFDEQWDGVRVFKEK